MVGQHGARTVIADLFGGLTNDHEGAVPGVYLRDKLPSGAENRGHVNVVTAGVHHADTLAGIILGGQVAGVGKSRFLFERQRVEFGAPGHCVSTVLRCTIYHRCNRSCFAKYLICQISDLKLKEKLAPRR